MALTSSQRKRGANSAEEQSRRVPMLRTLPAWASLQKHYKSLFFKSAR